MVMNHRLTALSFNVNQRVHPHSSNKAISNFDPPPFLISGYFKLWPLNYKVKVMSVVKGQDHTVSPVSNWFAYVLFHINQITIPQIQVFWNLTLKNQRSRSWVRSKVKVTVHPSIQPMHLNRINHSWDMSNKVFDLEKTHPKFLK